MIAVVDAGGGNLRSVEKGFAFLGHDVVRTGDPRVVGRADAVVVPGQGAFGDCMSGLARTGLVGAVRDAVAAGKPYLGICLGLQILFDGSEESGGCEGLAILRGRVVRFSDGARLADGRVRKIPHMGWNRLRDVRDGVGLAPVHYYFAHSFHALAADESDVAARVDYGEPVVAAVARPGLFACQFHPEKSQRAGLAILDRFAREAAR